MALVRYLDSVEGKDAAAADSATEGEGATMCDQDKPDLTSAASLAEQLAAVTRERDEAVSLARTRALQLDVLRVEVRRMAHQLCDGDCC